MDPYCVVEPSGKRWLSYLPPNEQISSPTAAWKLGEIKAICDALSRVGRDVYVVKPIY